MKKVMACLLAAIALMAQVPVKIVDGLGNEQRIGASGVATVYLMQAVPNSNTALASSTIKVQTILCNNQTASAATLTITDNDASPRTYYPAVSLAANSVTLLYAGTGFTMTGGIKWQASAATTIYCQIEGVQ